MKVYIDGDLREMNRRDLIPRVDTYRAGYLPDERRSIEKNLANRELLGVVSTNALELGVDIGGMDAVVLSGYPRTRMRSFLFARSWLGEVPHMTYGYIYNRPYFLRDELIRPNWRW